MFSTGIRRGLRGDRLDILRIAQPDPARGAL
jgi:hypothetical protein